MNPDSRLNQGSSRLHAAIIMDGNGRWAASRGLPRLVGHGAGAKAIRRIVAAAPALGIGTLTLYAFSKNNWERPAEEVSGLMRLFEDFFRTEREWWIEQSVRLSVIGRRNRLPSPLLTEIEKSQCLTRGGERLHLRLAVDYSGQDAILDAAQRLNASSPATRERFSSLLAQVVHAAAEDQNVDLLIRTGREQRLSDFLLWEIAYTELFFSPRYWPEFTPEDFKGIVEEFWRRERRFGRLSPALEHSPLAEMPLPVSV
jgi:undecaprenyl diphosphate synthase